MSYMLHPDEPVLLKTLKDNGYFVWWGGKNDLVPAQNGFATVPFVVDIPLHQRAFAASMRARVPTMPASASRSISPAS